LRIRDNLALKPGQYRLKIKGAPVAGGDLMTNHLLLMDPGHVVDRLSGVETTDPAFGLPALWVPKTQRERAEIAGYTVVDPTAVLITHLTEVLRAHAADILTRQDVQALLDHLKESNAAVVAEVSGDRGVSVGEIQKVLQHLLRERVSIRDLGTILETVSDNIVRTRDADALGELARVALARDHLPPVGPATTALGRPDAGPDDRAAAPEQRPGDGGGRAARDGARRGA
jgi:flagellar biosynthesis protein FlhA